MKKIILIFYFVLCICSFGAGITGRVNVENSENFGVFIQVENELKYDITNEMGNFEILGLEMNKEYTLSFQKDSYAILKTKIKLDEENKKIDIILKRVDESTLRYKVKGTIMSVVKKDIFIKLIGKGYSIIAKANETFYSDLELGKYKAEIIQQGSISKTIEFEVKKNEMNNLGVFKVLPKERNSLSIFFNDKVKNGYIFLYQNDILKYSEKLNSKKRTVFIDDLKKGDYYIKIIAQEKKDYGEKIYVKDKTIQKIKLIALKKIESVQVNLYPEDVFNTVKIFRGNILIEKKENEKGICIFEGLNPKDKYKIIIESDKYIAQEKRTVKPGEILNVAMEREIKGALITGNIFPFNSNAEIMLLEKGNILAKTIANENGSFLLDIDQIKSGRKLIRIKAEGFKEQKKYITINQGKEVKNFNVELKPIVTSLYGRILSNTDKSDLINTLVYIEKLNLSQYTNSRGEYYFRNIPEGVYKVNFKKIGYLDKEKLIRVSNRDLNKVNIVMTPIGKITFKSNLKGYELFINDEKIQVNSLIFEDFFEIGRKKIIARKKGYLNYENELIIEESGDDKFIEIEFKNLSVYKTELNIQLNEIEEMLEKKLIKEAEMKFYEIKRLKHSNLFKKKIDELDIKISKIKNNIFKEDRNIRMKFDEIGKSIIKIEESDLAYGEKRKKLNEKYKETIDYIEKVLNENYYTSFKYEIYMFQGDIYKKMGMLNSSKKSYNTAKKFKN